MSSPPLIEVLAHDPVLGKAKLIAEAWDTGGLYQVGSFPAWGRWAEWNGKYRDCLRRFIKSGAEYGPELPTRIEGSSDLYDDRSAEASINFITCHDGFTLYDLVSYSEKHNLDNGEDNRDGCNDNDSWNCGAEGDTDDAQINALRRRQIKNAVIILMLSRGIPMILSGDEFMNTQYRLHKDDMCMLPASCVLQTITFEVAVDAEEDSECIVLSGTAFKQMSEKYPDIRIFAPETAVSRFYDEEIRKQIPKYKYRKYTISEIINGIIGAGFTLERFDEHPSWGR